MRTNRANVLVYAPQMATLKISRKLLTLTNAIVHCPVWGTIKADSRAPVTETLLLPFQMGPAGVDSTGRFRLTALAVNDLAPVDEAPDDRRDRQLPDHYPHQEGRQRIDDHHRNRSPFPVG